MLSNSNNVSAGTRYFVDDDFIQETIQEKIDFPNYTLFEKHTHKIHIRLLISRQNS